MGKFKEMATLSEDYREYLESCSTIDCSENHGYCINCQTPWASCKVHNEEPLVEEKPGYYKDYPDSWSRDSYCVGEEAIAPHDSADLPDGYRWSTVSVGEEEEVETAHYNVGGIEPIDFINKNSMNFNLGNAVKYLSRCNYKGSKREDLLKAISYIEYELDSL